MTTPCRHTGRALVGISEGSGGLLDWWRSMDPEDAGETLHYALNDLVLYAGDRDRLIEEMFDEFDNLPGHPTAEFQRVATVLCYAWCKRMNDYREEEV